MDEQIEGTQELESSSWSTWVIALLVCLLVFQEIELLKLTRMTWKLEEIDKQAIVIDLRLAALRRSVDSIVGEVIEKDTLAQIDRWQYRSWQEFLDSLAAEGYRIDSVTFEQRGPI